MTIKQKPQKRGNKSAPKKADPEKKNTKSGGKKTAIDTRKPFKEAEGRWVKRAKFLDEKSFGVFICHRCKKSWQSAHSFPDYKQGCKKCNSKFYPVYLWVNDKKKKAGDKEMAGKGTTTLPDVTLVAPACAGRPLALVEA
eukprot:CAMPEP_0174257416 /NCGR_PEP_ID=MMETSP0439-20130205/6549_1 /TAXON_ID=0 /ORGANISM="Stereomyxa ramosa, Strain Chinc5" /LENGTH=139 /DNA_ID=CAMNT_0015340489 /DNA_START=46 /DNA_END=466 /DNA_ORIENTATION=+